LVGNFVPNLPQGLSELVIVLGFGVAVPVSCGIAIFKHGLYELDIVVSKTVVYGVLAAFFTAVYVAVVVGIGTAVGSRRNPFLTLVAAALIALAFNPVRDRAKRFANRMVYGKRATPYEVLSEFAERMAGAYAIEDVIPRTARMLAEGTGAVRADVWLRIGPELRAEGSWPSASHTERIPLVDVGAIDVPGASRVVEVRHQGELLGALSIQKAPRDPVTPTEERLLDDVASQAGLVLRNVRLIEELRASRQRIVAAQDQERQRLERNIHDGAQQQMVALAVKVRLARSLSNRDPQKADGLLEQTERELTQAMDDLRDLARGIYPPLLADRGLLVALQAQAKRSAVPVTVTTDGISRYPQEQEAAVYFCTLEALQNVAKYANASNASVGLAERGDSLTFTVRDDGVGFDPSTKGYGTGMQGMSDRLAALGGELRVTSAPGEGTTVMGKVPVDVP
jgi:signal transduction histidine kinase